MKEPLDLARALVTKADHDLPPMLDIRWTADRVGTAPAHCCVASPAASTRTAALTHTGGARHVQVKRSK